LSLFAGTPVSNVGVAADTGLVSYLEAHQHSAPFLVAINGSPAAAPLIVVTGRPVIALGGYHGTDPAPTKAQFQTMVATGRVHYALVGTPSSSHYAQGQVDRWIVTHGTIVPSSAYGGNLTGLSLYRLS
jgi:4-amino-4-deoxy-L-arabinose transferase-like glycosyltransferase